tara:strand:+ start:4235 stop:4405 length:171 start_codon:yes stop_codon:yes gene_type:complete
MKVLLVDDHPMVRRGFKDGLESTFEEDNEIFEAGFVDDAIEVLILTLLMSRFWIFV